MIWLSWRQFRTQAVVGAAALVAIAAYLVMLGTRIRQTRDGYLARCQSDGDCAELMSQFHLEYITLLFYLDGLLLLFPVLLGIFWGAPLLARELEAGTHRLVWNQSVTRRRWLVVKLLLAGLAAMAATGLASALLTWAAAPVDEVAGDRFSTVVFGARHIAPVAYAAFAVVLGAVIGMLVRRTVPAMALALLVLAVVQIVTPNLVRPHLMSPVAVTVPMTADAINDLRGLGGLGNEPSVRGLTIPDAWVTYASELRTPDGEPLGSALFNECISTPPPAGDDSRFGGAAQCLAAHDLHVDVAYQPNDRYWPFQWLESAMYLALTLVLAGFARWRINLA